MGGFTVHKAGDPLRARTEGQEIMTGVGAMQPPCTGMEGHAPEQMPLVHVCRPHSSPHATHTLSPYAWGPFSPPCCRGLVKTVNSRRGESGWPSRAPPFPRGEGELTPLHTFTPPDWAVRWLPGGAGDPEAGQKRADAGAGSAEAVAAGKGGGWGSQGEAEWAGRGGGATAGLERADAVAGAAEAVAAGEGGMMAGGAKERGSNGAHHR